MRVDLETLAATNRLAREGAAGAAACLRGLAGVETTVEVVKVAFAPTADALEAPDGVGVRVGLSGAIDGETVLAFDPHSARSMGEILTGESAVDGSVVREVGNVLTSGFVDGWADHVGDPIEITPPTLVDGPTVADDGHVVAFSSRIETVDGDVALQFVLVPDPDSLRSALVGRGDEESEGIAVEKLAGFAELTRHGAATVSESLSAMADIETVVEISELNYVPVEGAIRAVDPGPVVGTVAEFGGPPGGFVAVLFTEPAARRLVGALVPDADDPFEGMGRSAVREIGNVTATGFLDGWANVLETTIDVTPPRFVHDLGGAVLDPVVAHLGSSQEYAFACNGTVETDDERFDCTVYALPDEAELAAALADLDVGRVADGSAERL